MKQQLLLIFLIITGQTFGQEKENILKKFDTSGMETEILVQKSPLINIQSYQEKNNDVYGFFQAYKTIQQSDLLNRFPSLEKLKQDKKESFKNNIIPLTILISAYETIKKEAIYHDTEGFLIRNTTENIFEKQTLFVSTALRLKFKGLVTKFKLSNEHIFNSTNNTIKEIRIDFNNGDGFQKINIDKTINVSYQKAGTKTLIFEITFNDDTIINNKSSLKIQYSNSNLTELFDRSPANFTASITPDLSVYGESTSYPGEGEFEIFLSTEVGAVFDKPLIIIDGFDPQDGRPILGYTDNGTGSFVSGIYDLLDFTASNGSTVNLGDLIRVEGYDLVVLNFPEYVRTADNELVDGGADFIERNAMLLVELINIINNQKVGNFQNVIIGPSMGGLISRYALNYMESESLDHDTRLWLSFDAPHLGANVPIGFQHQFNFLAFGLNDFWFIGNQNVEALQPLINGFMKSAAARQMLVDHFESHITDSDGVTFNSSLTLPVSHPFKELFFNRLNSLSASGYPENLRKINMINGSGIGLPYQDINGNNILPGRQVVDVSIDVTTGTEAFLEVNFTPYSNQQIEVSDVYIDFAWYIPAFDVYNDADSRAHPYSNGVDAASGGLFNLGQIVNDVDTSGLAGEFLAALQTDYFNFIPSVSAMDISFPNNEIDWFLHPNTSHPFDAVYMPTQNEPHVTLTQENFDFAWDEIVTQASVSILDNNLENGLLIAENPISEQLILINNLSINKLEIELFDVSGKMVLQTIINQPTNRIEIPIILNSGVYFTKLIADGNIVFKKLMVN